MAITLMLPRVDAAPPEFHQAVADSGAALHYRFDESAGPAINYGTLGSAYNANYLGSIQRLVPTCIGDFCVAFNGSDDYLESQAAASAAFLGNPTFTAETVVFIPTNGFATLWPPFLHWGQGATGREVYFSLQHNRPDVAYSGFYNAGLRATLPFPLGRWHHIVWVRQGGGNAITGTTLYIDGQSVALEVDTDLCCNATVPDVVSTAFRVNRARDFTRYFTGSMDELALYPRALAESEVIAHYSATRIGQLPGDLNCDGIVNNFDIDPFVLALVAPDQYEAAFPNCDRTAADANGDGSVDNFDIDPFVQLLTCG
ncbi:MAG: hypothetical protein JNG88_14365 [Phycisphaerales bacterium]|nr:hypothetical protein [Phycisphaerales bacterium]